MSCTDSKAIFSIKKSQRFKYGIVILKGLSLPH